MQATEILFDAMKFVGITGITYLVTVSY